MGFCCLSAAWLKVKQDRLLSCIKDGGTGDGGALPSVGSQLKCILQPVQKFVGKLTDILKQRGKEKGGTDGD